MPEISVVIPVYKVEKYLDRCVESVVSQSFEDLEIILVDDGSPDNCGAMCDAWAKRDERIRVIHQENGGLSAARNAGTAGATAPYIGYVDSDDYIEPEMYEILYRNMRHTRADISCCGVRDVFANHTETPPHKPMRVMSVHDALEDIMLNKTMQVSAWCRLYPTELMRKTPFLEGRIHEDAWIVVDLFSQVERVVMDTRALYNYWHNQGTLSMSAYTPRVMDSVDAWEYNLGRIRELYPDLEYAALYRCYWWHFDVLDKMVLSDPDTVPKEDLDKVVGYLKEHASEIFADETITSARKFALRTLQVSLGAYRALVKANYKRMGIIA